MPTTIPVDNASREAWKRAFAVDRVTLIGCIKARRALDAWELQQLNQ